MSNKIFDAFRATLGKTKDKAAPRQTPSDFSSANAQAKPEEEKPAEPKKPPASS